MRARRTVVGLLSAVTLAAVPLAVTAGPAAAGSAVAGPAVAALPDADMEAVVLAAQRDPVKTGTGITPGAGPSVLLVERALAARGLLAASLADGHFGTSTISAYAAYQRSLGYTGLDANGLPGRTSLTRLGTDRFRVVRPIGPGERVTYLGRTVNTRTRAMLQEAQRRAGRSIVLTQGSYNPGGDSTSAGTHDGGGAVDISVSGMSATTRTNVVRQLREVGFAAWYRPAIPGVWGPHLHAVAISDTDLSRPAQEQVGDYYLGRDGLAGDGPDTGPAVTKRTWETYQRSRTAVPAAWSGTAVPAADRTLRVYSNNIENLVRNNPDGTCTRISGPEHLSSMLVDDAGRTGTAGVAAPDLLIVQQVRGTGQASAYADQLSAKFGLPAGTYRAVVAWADPEEWGGSHRCSSPALGDLKKKQTNGLIWNTRRLSLTDVSKYWSAGWLKPGRAYADGGGCTLYKPPDNDDGATYEHKWKRTTAIAARFTIVGTSTTVFAATMHLPQENRQHACAGEDDKGIAGSGIHVAADARSLLAASTIRVVGIDANRTGIAASTLGGYGMTGYGTAATSGSSKIDYLFVRGTVRPSPVGHTVAGTKSNHLALYAFLPF